MNLTAKKSLVMLAFVLSCCSYPALFMQIASAFHATTSFRDAVQSGTYQQGQHYQPPARPRAIRRGLWLVSSVGWVAALAHALFVRLPRFRAKAIGWPVVLLLFGALAAPFYLWQHLWSPLHREGGPINALQPTPLSRRG